MSERNITYLTNACLITCIVEMGSAEKVLEAAKNSGAQGATINYARGTGIREKLGLLGVCIVKLFFEISCSTRISFELAQKRLSADTVNFSASSSAISSSNSSSRAITSSTVSSESAPRSSTKEASLCTSSSFTPSCSQISFLTRSSMLLMRLDTPSVVLGAKRANSIDAL